MSLFKALRKQRGLSQSAIGYPVNLPQSHISAIENGRYIPGAIIQKRITDYFGLSWAELMAPAPPCEGK
jgi:transcriptional regulator with XRE-family HTH domain